MFLPKLAIRLIAGDAGLGRVEGVIGSKVGGNARTHVEASRWEQTLLALLRLVAGWVLLTLQ